MNYVEKSLKIYDSIIKSKTIKLDLNADYIYESFINMFSKEISAQDLLVQYRNEINSIIEDNLSNFNTDINLLRQLKEVQYYENSVAISTSFAIFWIAHNKVDISKTELSDLVKAVFIGTVGYRLLDLHNDQNKLESHFSILGYYLIHQYEKTLLEVFNYPSTFEIINKYVSYFSEVEYLEKKHRWAKCPFSWDEPEKIGLKAAPLFAIFELIFLKANLDQDRIDMLIRGLINWAAAIQMADDITDAHEDLSSGIETLVMSGFYHQYPKPDDITPELINNFLDKKRTLKFYDTTQMLFDVARDNFIKCDDEILTLYNEIQNYRFNSDIEIS